VFEGNPKVEVDSYEGLTINYCKKVDANYIVRGIRSAADFEYEKTIAHLNNAMQANIETILILSKPELAPISSTIVREIIIGKGDVSKFVPAAIASYFE
jgi:pantetheine-phosphate adenylyltransferase